MSHTDTSPLLSVTAPTLKFGSYAPTAIKKRSRAYAFTSGSSPRPTPGDENDEMWDVVADVAVGRRPVVPQWSYYSVSSAGSSLDDDAAPLSIEPDPNELPPVAEDYWQLYKLSVALSNRSNADTFSPDNSLIDVLDDLYREARAQTFEVGTDSAFAKSLQFLSDYDPHRVFASLKEHLGRDDSASDVSAEILRWASRQDNASVRNQAIELLIAGLFSSSSLVRDAAAIGFASLDAMLSVDHLRDALARELVPELRLDLADLIESLEIPDSWHISSES